MIIKDNQFPFPKTQKKHKEELKRALKLTMTLDSSKIPKQGRIIKLKISKEESNFLLDFLQKISQNCYLVILRYRECVICLVFVASLPLVYFSIVSALLIWFLVLCLIIARNEI